MAMPSNFILTVDMGLSVGMRILHEVSVDMRRKHELSVGMRLD